MKKIKYKLLPLIIAFVLVLSPMCVCASGVEWSKADKVAHYATNALTFMFEVTGVLLSSANGGTTNTSVQQAYEDFLLDNYQTQTSYSYEDYIDAHFTVDESGSEPVYTIDATMSDDMHSFMREWIEENTGFYTLYTYDMPELATYFNDYVQYNAVVSKVNSCPSDSMCVVVPKMSGTDYASVCYVKYDGLIFGGNINSNYIYSTFYYQWAMASYNYGVNDNVTFLIDRYGNDVTETYYFNIRNVDTLDGLNIIGNGGKLHGDGNPLIRDGYIVTRNSQAVRSYKTFNEYKLYAVGERAYFTTDKWGNYQSGQGNTITQSELENCSLNYGTIINTVTNEGDGLSEDALQQLIETLLNNNSGGSSGGSVSDNGGSSSGGGLSGLFTGIGAVFDVIMSILGRLLEYVGQALDLFGDTITNLIDRIPTGFTQLLTGLFPFIPEEWVSAIGLSLVLGIIGAVVGIFKK